jgi:hypothetical protein
MLGLRGLGVTSMTTQGEAFDSLGFQLLQQDLPTPSPLHIINKQISLAQNIMQYVVDGEMVICLCFNYIGNENSKNPNQNLLESMKRWWFKRQL